MNFIADFHIHSHFSRATAKNLDLPHIYKEAQIKGITLIGTGDFTHPGWFAALSESLVPAEPGLYALKPELAKTVESQIPQSCRSPVRFILTVEISNIYKKNGRTRKNHNLLFMPDLEAVNTLNTQLDRIGNIHSDGRPILGLDAHHLLDMTLNAHERGFLIPAHIWTPWFSMLGSKSGFDTLTECFDDLSDYIFAVETGLSSDPPMNRRVSFLDHLTLVSNSDAHSPDKLGREANLFNTHLSYDAIYDAMKSGNGFDGTIEFYPEEGKYHLDGHRKCDIRFTPEESQTNNGLCPTCGKPLTLGVLYRVNELADRLEQDVDSPHFESLIPLKEILSEILQKGPKTKTVAKHYQTAIEQLGSEFHILRHCPLETIETAHIPLLAEAIKRLRSGHVHLSGGYDGEFGTVRVFEQSEIETIKGQQSLFHMGTRKQKPRQPPKNQVVKKRQFVFNEIQNHTITLNSAQQSVVSSRDHHLIIIAGPGTGKTRTITTRIASLITDHQVPPHNILAVTFTQKAAMEMKHRLLQDFNQQQSLPMVATFHALCLYILENELPESQSFRILNETEQDFCVTIARNNCVETKLPSKKQCKKWIETAKQQCLSPNDDLSSISNDLSFKTVYQAYTDVLKEYQSMDFEDILFQTIQLFQKIKPFEKNGVNSFPIFLWMNIRISIIVSIH
ncbi:MAG: UvrD/REP helicase [Candidatus Magnetoglobus multicellularis str. Araruama]|uniref:UvrD/REP helicase n=1 Tax=Candidatus Magnetoglobus multicellularis str. Araruama TaxID=890399 RepID=A0A1V1P8J8_9BACT|nr:MAG: UvrD/REP helicase [Candidatus Magnetoglobus multicellularis str. Araruama]